MSTLADGRPMTEAEFAAYINKSTRTIRRYVKDGLVTYVQSGRARLYPRASVEEYLAANEVTPVPVIKRRRAAARQAAKTRTAA